MLTISNVRRHQEISVKTINFITGRVVPCSEITPMQAIELIISSQHEKNSQILQTRSHLAFLTISLIQLFLQSSSFKYPQYHYIMEYFARCGIPR